VVLAESKEFHGFSVDEKNVFEIDSEAARFLFQHAPKQSTCSPVILPLMNNTTSFSAVTTRSILQLICLLSVQLQRLTHGSRRREPSSFPDLLLSPLLLPRLRHTRQQSSCHFQVIENK